MTPSEPASVPARHPSSPEVVRFGPFRFDRASRLLFRGLDEVSLPPRAIAVLELLLDRAGRVVSKATLLDEAWGGAFVTETSLTEAVSLVRQALGDDPQAPTYVQTVHRRGYRFVAAVTADVPAPLRVAAPPARSDTPEADPSAPAMWRRRWAAPLAFGLLAVGAALGIAFAGRLDPAPRAPVRFTTAPPDGFELALAGPALALSPVTGDLVFTVFDDGGTRLAVRAADSFGATALPGTEGGSAPFPSPDGQWVGFFRRDGLYRIAIAGGPAVRVVSMVGGGVGSWAPDGSIVYAPESTPGIWRVTLDGGSPEVLIRPDPSRGEVGLRWPEVLPDGRHVLYTVWSTILDTARVDALSLEDGSVRTVVRGGSGARFDPRGRLIFLQGATVVSAPFDPADPRVLGPARPLRDPVWFDPEAGLPQVALSRDDVAYVPGALGSQLREVVLVRGGPPEPLRLPRRHYRNVEVSPDGGTLALTALDGSRSDVWTARLDAATPTRLTFGGFAIEPVWSPDGRRVAFASSDGGPFRIVERAADGTGAERTLLSGAEHLYPSSWSPDGRWLVYGAISPEGGFDLRVLDVATRRTRPLRATSAQEVYGLVHPSGRAVAYASNESGRWEVYVESFPRPGGRWQVSSGGGHQAFWSAEGRELLYFGGEKRLFAVPVRVEPEVVLGPAALRPLPPGVSFAQGMPGGLVALREVDGGEIPREVRVVRGGGL